MNAEIMELWLIVKCPHCHRPQVRNKYVMHNQVYWFTPVRPIYCTHCAKPYKIDAKLKRIDDADVPERKEAQTANV